MGSDTNPEGGDTLIETEQQKVYVQDSFQIIDSRESY